MRRDKTGKPIIDNKETDTGDVIKHVIGPSDGIAQIKQDKESGKWSFDIYANDPVASSDPIFTTEKQIRKFLDGHIESVRVVKPK